MVHNYTANIIGRSKYLQVPGTCEVQCDQSTGLTNHPSERLGDLQAHPIVSHTEIIEIIEIGKILTTDK